MTGPAKMPAGLACTLCAGRVSPREVAAGYRRRAGVLCENCWAETVGRCHDRDAACGLFARLVRLVGPPAFNSWDSRLEPRTAANLMGWVKLLQEPR